MRIEDDPDEPLIAFLDANIILQGKPMADLPWHEIAVTGTIRALIVPRAMEEIDAKKRDGRLGEHARKFNRLIGPSVIEGKPVAVRESGPRVELEMATCSRIPWADFDELDPDDGDSRIVAEALHVRNISSEKRLLVSHDIKPLAYARGRGLPVYQASDDWLRPVEPSPQDKEIQRLKGQLAEFRKDEPTCEVSIEVGDAKPLTILKVSPLTDEQGQTLVRTIKLKNGRKQNSDRDGLMFNPAYDSSYDGKYRRYIDKTIPRLVAQFPEKMELLFNQRPIVVRVSNVGQIRADHLVISIRTSDGSLNRKIIYVSPGGPSAPYPQAPYLAMDLHRGIRDFTPERVGRHEFETTIAAERSPETEVSCENFRSGQDYHFEGYIAPTSDDVPLEIIVSITAANLRGEFVETRRIEKKIMPTYPHELVDLDALRLKRDYRLKAEVERLVSLEQFGRLDRDDETD